MHSWMKVMRTLSHAGSPQTLQRSEGQDPPLKGSLDGRETFLKGFGKITFSGKKHSCPPSKQGEMTSHQAGQKVKWMESTSDGRGSRKTPKLNLRVDLKVSFSSLKSIFRAKRTLLNIKARCQLPWLEPIKKKKGFYGLKWICPQQDDKMSEFFVEVPAVCESAPFLCLSSFLGACAERTSCRWLVSGNHGPKRDPFLPRM